MRECRWNAALCVLQCLRHAATAGSLSRPEASLLGDSHHFAFMADMLEF